MKIGILTFHSQLNYGGVLQCWALQQAMKDMGHEVVVIDRDFDDLRSLRKACERRSVRSCLLSHLKSAFGSNCEQIRRRAKSTLSFLENFVTLTDYHFVDWCNAPKVLGVDLMVVGSDQVWHCGNWGDPRPYLLEGAPVCPAISYAASFGMEAISDSEVELYKRGLDRFSAISVRESSACKLVSQLGFTSEAVLDPTLLIDDYVWVSTFGPPRPHVEKRIVCYFVDTQEEELRGSLNEFRLSTGCKIDVFMNLQKKSRGSFWKPLHVFNVLRERYFANLTFRYESSPVEFVQAFRDSDLIVTDSFHALMLATIFKKNIRILLPKVDWLKISFSRIKDFTSRFVSGEIFVDTLSKGLFALYSDERINYNYDALQLEKNRSTRWLMRAISGSHNKPDRR